MVKYVKWGLIGLGGLIVLGLAVLYGGSEGIIRHRIDAPLPQIAASTDLGAVARGAHLGRTRGCDGCHGRNLQGEPFLDEDFVATIDAANVTRAIQTYTDPELARLIRQGVKRDGRPLWIMPSATFSTLTDRDTADIIAWLRTHPAAGPEHPAASIGPLGRLGLLMGKFAPASAEIPKAQAAPAFDAGPAFSRGRYIAVTVCSECHGSNLKGASVAGEAPDLLIAASYDRAGFTRLMRTGIAADGKTKGLMSEVARDNFSAFTDQEIADLHDYLTARAERAP